MASQGIESPAVFVILDIETTGLADEDKVVQIGCLKIDEGGKSKWMRYINPCLPREKQLNAFHIHGISPESLINKPTFKEISKSFLEFLSDTEFIVAHNGLFDWSMLWKEFRELHHDDNPGDEFLGKCKWLDLLRLSILHFPHLSSHTLNSLKTNLRIDSKELASELADGDDGDQWKQRPHDAMYDVITTYQVLLNCMEGLSFRQLVNKYDNAILDTNLFSEMQYLLENKKTSNEDLLPFADRAKDYFTTSRPKGKTLGTLPKDMLLRMTNYHKDDPRTDRRIVLIYRAAYLNAPYHAQEQHSVPTNVDDNAEDGKAVAVNGENTRESNLLLSPSKQLPLKYLSINNKKATTIENDSQTENHNGENCGKRISDEKNYIMEKTDDKKDYTEPNVENEKQNDCQSTPPKRKKII